MRQKHPARKHGQRGAALLTAMIIVTLVVTLSASMVWQQWRAVQVEVAERSRVQSAWILAGALDWARLILTEDFKSGQPTGLNSPWAVPLAEARLSSFLAADKDNNTDEDGPEAFLSGSISDAQARYNVTNLGIVDPTVAKTELEAFKQLCQNISVSVDVASRIATGMHDAMATTGKTDDTAAPLLPRSVAQLSWFGIDAATIQALTPYIAVLPAGDLTKVNLNTAPREVLAAVLPGLDLGSADRIVQARQRTAFSDKNAVQALISGLTDAAMANVVYKSDYFDVRGRLRLTDRVLEELSLVKRQPGNGQVVVVQTEKVASRETTGS